MCGGIIYSVLEEGRLAEESEQLLVGLVGIVGVVGQSARLLLLVVRVDPLEYLRVGFDG